MSPLELAWNRWDAHPRDPVAVLAMEHESAVLAGGLGVTTTVLRGRLAAFRRAGVARSDAIAKAGT